MLCRIVPCIPGRRPTDEDDHPGLGSSDNAMVLTGDDEDNATVLLFEVADLADNATVEATVCIDGTPLPGWDRRPVPVDRSAPRQRLELRAARDLSGVGLGFASGFLREANVELCVVHDGTVTAYDEANLDVCDARLLGSLYQRLIDRLVAADTSRQARAANVADPGPEFHPWYPVLSIGTDKAARYTTAVLGDIVGKEHHLRDSAWLLRVGVYLELLTVLGIVEAVRDDAGDLLEPDERDAFETSAVFDEIRTRITPEVWRDVWRQRTIMFPTFASPRTGPVSALNLIRKRDATLRFLHAHHDDLKHAIELAGPNHVDAQETWQRVFRDAERAVMNRVGDAFPELSYLPGPAREIVLWQRFGFAGQQGVYPTACSQYRASMNAVADWAKSRGLMDHAGPECIPPEASLVEAIVHDRSRVAILQRQDELGPDLRVTEPVMAEAPTVEEVETLVGEVPIFRMLGPDDLHTLALGARPLLLGPTERFVIQDHLGTSLFLVGEGEVEVRLRNADGTDWMVERMGRGEVVGEMALVTGEARTATVRSVDESVVYEIGRQQFQPLLLQHPEWIDELATIMEERLARRRSRIEQLDAETQPLLVRIRRNFFG